MTKSAAYPKKYAAKVQALHAAHMVGDSVINASDH